MTEEEYINHNGQFTNVRFEHNTYKQMKKEIKHDLRMVKVDRVVKPDKPTILINYTNGEIEYHSLYMKSKEAREIGQKIIDQMEEVENRHRKLLRTNYNQSLNKERVSSFNMGVLTFSDSMRELAEKNLDEVIEIGKKTIENICKKYDIKLHYISFHMDEKGIPHFHYYTDNFNSMGRTINPKRNKKMGERLQDLGVLFFKKLGFNRGLSKEITGGRHMSIEEYKRLKDLDKKNGELEAENKRLKGQIVKMENLQDEIFVELVELVKEFYEIGMNYKGKSAEELLELFKRYFENEAEFEKLFNKVVKLGKKKGLFGDYERFKSSDMAQNVKELNKIKKQVKKKTSNNMSMDR